MLMFEGAWWEFLLGLKDECEVALKAKLDAIIPEATISRLDIFLLGWRLQALVEELVKESNKELDFSDDFSEEVLFFRWGEGVTTLGPKIDKVFSTFSKEFSIDLSESNEKHDCRREEAISLEVLNLNETLDEGSKSSILIFSVDEKEASLEHVFLMWFEGWKTWKKFEGFSLSKIILLLEQLSLDEDWLSSTWSSYAHMVVVEDALKWREWL